MFTVTLTQREIGERSQSLAQYTNKLIELEEEEETEKAEYKRTMADIKERRLGISAEIRRLSRAVRLGVEERNGQAVLFDYERAKFEAGRGNGDEPEATSDAENVAAFFDKSAPPVLEECVCGHPGRDHTIRGFCGGCDCKEFLPKLNVASSEDDFAAQIAADEEVAAHEAKIEAEEDRATAESIRLGEHPFAGADKDIGGTPFPTQFSQTEINEWAENYHAAMKISEGDPVKICRVLGQPFVIVGADGSGDAKNWSGVTAWPVLPLANAGEENAKTYREASDDYYDDEEHNAFSYLNIKINCGSKKKPDWWVMVGPEIIFTVKREGIYVCQGCNAEVEFDLTTTDGKCAKCWTPYDAAAEIEHHNREIAIARDDFTAERCEECGRIDGGHAPTCSKSEALAYPAFLAYCKAKDYRQPASAARKMELTRDPDAEREVRAWLQAEKMRIEKNLVEVAPDEFRFKDQPELKRKRKKKVVKSAKQRGNRRARAAH